MYQVAPHAGARIETAVDFHTREDIAGRPSCRGADRNYRQLGDDPDVLGSPLMQGRGSKPLDEWIRKKRERRPSCRGADRNPHRGGDTRPRLGSPLMQGRGSKQRHLGPLIITSRSPLMQGRGSKQ